MDFFLKKLTDMEVYGWETFIDDWFFVFSFGFLALEFIRYTIIKKISWNLIADTVVNYATLAFYLGLSFLVLGGLYISSFFYAYQFAVLDIPTNWATVIICIILADLIYYWEHRFMHRVNFAWATHTVHHSSPFFNISVAYRFGPMDGFWPIFFHVPLILLGFNPFVVFFAEVMVQLYQTLLHTEGFKKFPRPIEAIMNTPSHHRVHHGSNPKYLDKNYAGIFIIWDKMFGTFEQETEEVVYGLVTPINSNNPFVAFFHGFYRLSSKVASANGLKNKLGCVIFSPGWEPSSKKKQVKQ